MALDNYKNLALAQIATPPSPATTGTTMTFVAGQGAYLPTPPFNVTIFNGASFPTPANAEIARITAMSGDSVTAMVRAQEGSTARAIVANDYAAATFTTKFVTDITDSSNQVSGTLPNARLNANVTVGTSVAVGTNPASVGAIRLPNNTTIVARNAANTADVNLLSLNGANNVALGGGTTQVVLTPTAFYPNTDNTMDLGASAPIRYKNAWIAQAVIIGTNPAQSGAIRLANAATIQARNAANNADVAALTVTAADAIQLGGAGTNVLHGGDLYEKGRTTPIGHWITVPYDTNNFQSAAGQTGWTVPSGSVVSYQYTLIGKTLILNFYLGPTTVSPATSELRLMVPTYPASAVTLIHPITASDAGGAWATAWATLGGGEYIIRLRRDPQGTQSWTAGSGTYVAGQLVVALP